MIKKWFMYTRGTIELHRLAVTYLGINKFGSRFAGVPFTDILCLTHEKKLWWGWDERQLQNLFAVIMRRCKKSTSAKEHFANLEKYASDSIRTSEKSLRVDLRKLNNRELASFYRRLFQNYALAHGLLDNDIDAIDAYFEEFLQNLIKKSLKGQESNFIEVYRALSKPVYLTYVSQMELEILKSVTAKNLGGAKKLHRKWWWTSLGWENMHTHSEKYFGNAIRQAIRKGDARKRLKQILFELKSTAIDRVETLKRYNLGKDIRYWLGVLDRYAAMHDLRKEMQVKTVYSLHQILLEIARRKSLKPAELEWLWPEELLALLGKRRFDRKLAQARVCYCYILCSSKGIQTLAGAQARLKLQKFLKNQTAETDSVKGMGLTSGRARGIAKICAGYKDALQKVKSGDVLICGMTLPDYVPAMKKSGAIVTDEGGITCHAAIVSRELGKICVVGTKIATQVFKDGDLVEVDADKGIVRKL